MYFFQNWTTTISLLFDDNLKQLENIYVMLIFLSHYVIEIPPGVIS